MNRYFILMCVYAFTMQLALPTRKSKNPYPLHTAVSHDQVSTVQMLLQHPSGKFDINGRDQDGNTPLHIAAKKSALACLTFLLVGSTINSKPSNDNESQEDEFYPKKGARVFMVELEAKNKEGNTALEVALITAQRLANGVRSSKYAAIIQQLLAHKAQLPSAEWLHHHDSCCASILARCQNVVQYQAVDQRQEAVVQCQEVDHQDREVSLQYQNGDRQCQKRGSIAKTSLCVML